MNDSDARWAFLEAARRLLLDRLAVRGVDQVVFVAAFPQDDFAVWLCTQTDSQRDALDLVGPLRDTVRACLIEAGFAADQLARLHFVAQSQETVDRDYEGSWFYATR